MSSSDIARKRSALFSVRVCFSPETQPIRETAIEKIVEQNMLVVDSEKGISLKEIEETGALCFVDGAPAIVRADIESALERLTKNKRVVITEDTGEKRFRLSDGAIEELSRLQDSIENRFDRVIQRLFETTGQDPSDFKQAFLDCLCIVFSRLGATYVRLIKGEIASEEVLRSPSVISALQEVQKRYPELNVVAFSSGILEFFRQVDPDYDVIKWNMAQNYYIAHALGVYGGIQLLSDQVFGNAVFYVDTNVVIHALEPKARHHGSFNVFSSACNKLQTELKVCQVTIDELRGVVTYHREMLPKVAQQIPNETAKKVPGIFFQLYHSQQASKDEVNLDEVFSSFDQPTVDLAELYEVELVDDSWFDQAATDAVTKRLCEEIRSDFLAKRNRRKSKPAALHDVLLIRWVQEQRSKGNNNVWILTLDTSLPGFLPEEGVSATKSLAITLDAVLQWISPIAIDERAEDKVAGIFSEAVKYQLLPQEVFFRIQDFLVLAEMEWSCKELPAEDVEKCIQYLKVFLPELDPLDPRDREKLAHEVHKFFADPSRKYKQELERLEEAHQGQLDTMKQKVKKLEEEIELKNQDRASERLRRSVRFRLSVVFGLFVLLESLAMIVGGLYGSGENFLQRLANLWVLPTTTFAVVIFLGLLILGKDRVRELGWPFSKLFHDSEGG